MRRTATVWFFIAAAVIGFNTLGVGAQPQAPTQTNGQSAPQMACNRITTFKGKNGRFYAFAVDDPPITIDASGTVWLHCGIYQWPMSPGKPIHAQ